MADEDVTQSDPSPDEATLEAHADPTPVSGEAQASDRPVQNIVAEFNRKLGKTQDELNRKIDAVLQYLASTPQPQVTQSPSRGQGELSTEDLWALAQQGNRQAFEEYQRRIAREELQQGLKADRGQTFVVSQLNTLVSKYPVLRDASHPLTQHAHQAYQVLVQNGYPTGNATLLEAAKTAIADRPDLVSEIYSQSGQAREQVRQTATSRAQAGVMGAQHRRDSTPPASQGRQVKVTPESIELAKRMGVKDPKGAKERHAERMAKGQSTFGSVAAFIKEED